MSAKPIVLNVNGLRFDALQEGPDHGQLVLFLHGFPEFADAWIDIMHPLAAAGFRAVAVDQRGYSPGARPPKVEDYAVDYLLSDILGFADTLGSGQFHLAAHDWGGLLAWSLAAAYPDRIQSLTVLSTPHPDAFLAAVEKDEDQKQRSRYISLFRMPGGAAESLFQADNYRCLRGVYQGKVPEQLVNENVRRLSQPGALTAALNWYRALNLDTRIGHVSVPTLYVWGSQDMALGEVAAVGTAIYVDGPYRFERLDGRSHWLIEEPDLISPLLLDHLQTNAGTSGDTRS